MYFTDILNLKSSLQLIAITPPKLLDPSLAIAATRAGGIGILDLEFTNDLKTSLDAINTLVYHSRYICGIKLNGEDSAFITAIIPKLPKGINIILLTSSKPENLVKYINDIHLHNRLVFLEVTTLEQARLGYELKVDGLVAKGNESAGFVGEKTAFILFQQIVSNLSLPVWVQGGIGLNTAAACYAGGAAGIVLDSQLYLTKESPLSDEIKKHIRRMDGSETICLGGKSVQCRIYNRPGIKFDDELCNREEHLENAQNTGYAVSLLRKSIRKYIAWDQAANSLWLLGQDAAFAEPLARRFSTVGSVFQAIRKAVNEHVHSAKSFMILNKESPLAKSHNTLYPIVQGPMARVSDNAEFLAQVAKAGALPFLALSNLRGEGLKGILREVTGALGDRPWGVGILGFNKNELFESQMEAINLYKPAFAVIAGGMPGQIAMLESRGISTYVHVQSTTLLEMFIDSGLRRFIFEGRECGGHIGPRSSFVLWEVMIEKLLEKLKVDPEPEKFHILFAGGIHNALSAAMVASMASPLAQYGARIGVLMGTAYLFTKEIVETGAIAKGFQKNALRCSETSILESGPGHAVRCCNTPFVRFFENEKRRLLSEKIHQEKIRSTLDTLVLGRLRIASKGLTRNPDHNSEPGPPYLIQVSEEKQETEGLYMIGQLAALKDNTGTIEDLHHEVSVRSTEILASLSPLKDDIRPEAAADIAITGMACLYPKAGNLQTYWENILDKVNAISEVPETRWDWRLYFDKNIKARDKIYSKWGGFLDDMPFDPMKYGIPPNSLSSIEPLHLMALEVVSAALKDAGYEDREFPREKTSVIFGTGSGYGDLGQNYIFRSLLPMFLQNPSEEILKKLPEWTEDSFPGILMNVLAGRIANRFNLGGVNYTMDAACASSLAALYDAVRELENGSSDMVIVGGADAGQSPFGFLCFSKTQALSQRGQCRVFDANADGTVISEGLAVLILKRLADAERDGDRIYAVVKAVKGSSDGRGKSMTAPRIEGQIAALRRAYEKAGFSSATVEMFEAHGTGTVVGDQIEAESASQFLKECCASRRSCAIGSVKSMIGHTKGAAGLAGLIKIALSLYHKVLPPTIGVDKPNPHVDFLNGPLYINTELRPWISRDSGPRRAGVSSFGFGGTNFHAVLEEYNDIFEKDKPALREQWPYELLLWAGNSKDELISGLDSVKAYFESGAAPRLGDLAVTLHKNFKELTGKEKKNISTLAIIASSLNDLKEKITSASFSLNEPGCKSISNPGGIYFSEKPLLRSGKIAFLFPGQGSQYPNMLRELTTIFSEMRSSFEVADSVLKERFPERLSSFIFPPPAFSKEEEGEQMQRLSQTNIAQPSLGAACYGMFTLLRSLNLNPDMVAGHSYGEYVALCAADVFSEETLYSLSEARGRFMIKAAKGQDLGTMAAVKAGVKELGELLKDADDVIIANINSPKQTVISGQRTAVARTVELLESKGIHAQLIPVAGAFHSHIVAPAKKMFSEFLNTVDFASPRIKVFSNSFAMPYKKTAKEIRDCLAEHMVMQVKFMDEIDAMYKMGARIFIEVGPGSVLTNLTRQILEGRSFLSLSTDSRGSSSLSQLLQTLAQLAVHGAPISLESLYKWRGLKEINLKEWGKEMQKNPGWLVSANGVRPAGENLNKKALKVSTVEDLSVSEGFPDEIQKLVKNIPFHGVADLQTGIHSDVDDVMQQFQRLMSKFLETQERIMKAYLQQDTLPSLKVDEPAAKDLPEEKEKLQDKNRYQTQEPVMETPDTVVETRAPASLKQDEVTMETIKEELLRVTSERTGYPKEMLKLDSDIEADLGIDSIKRVEILSTFTKGFSENERVKIQGIIDNLSKLKTLKAVIEKSADVLLEPETKSIASNTHQISGKQVSPGIKEIRRNEDGYLPRFVIEPVEAPVPEEPLQITGNKVFMITDDGRGVAEMLADKLRELGGQAVIVQNDHKGTNIDEGIYHADLTDPSAVNSLVREVQLKYGSIAGLVHLLPLGHRVPIEEMDVKVWRNYLKGEVKSLFYLTKVLSADIRDAGRKNSGWLMAATSLSGHPCAADKRDCFLGQAGIAGLLKTVAQEWPEVKCRVIHMEMDNPPSVLSDQLIREMAVKDKTVEVEYKGSNRIVYLPRQVSLKHDDPANMQINRDWVIMVTGGAVGITAEAAYELSIKYKPTLLLIGRSAYPEEETAETKGITSPHEIKEILMRNLRLSGDPLTPAKVEAAYARLLKDREIRQNVERMQQTGARVHYFQVDVRDEEGFGKLIDEIYESFGRLDGVIHGAGVIEDKLLEDKTYESFDRVFDTKADSAFILSRKLRPDFLKFIVFFTSVAGSFGNRGQADYAAANEVVNKLALSLDKRWKGRIVAINWGPWRKTGMVTTELERQFKERGIQVIPPAAGCRMFEEELRLGKKGVVEVVIGDGPWKM